MPTLPLPVFVAIVLIFAALRLFRAHGCAHPLGLALALCAVQTLIIALAQHYEVAGMRLVQPITASLIPPAAWLALQTTAVRRPSRLDLLHLLAPATALAALLVAPEFLDVLLPGLFVVYGALILYHALHGPDSQPNAVLSNGDVPSRIWLIIGVALIASALSDVLIVAAQIAGYGGLRPWIISIFSVGNLLVIGVLGMSPHLQTEGADDPAPPGPPEEVAEPDPKVWQRLTAYMIRHRPYLDPDLTLARLSRKLGVPAKTLSTTVNRATGENVSRFINKARIRAAQDAMVKGEPITQAMLASGFNTKSNFNREFLRIAGENPSAWLRKHGSQAGKRVEDTADPV